MKIAFRTDASLQIGSGHVMRCLTLADSLIAIGASCRFICREHSGHLLELIRQRGHEAIGLPATISSGSTAAVMADETKLAHAAWLGTDWRNDAAETLNALQGELTDWLVVDHYALDARWEHVLRPACRKLMVIDDLADRDHDCDLLLDQNLGRQRQDYASLVPSQCRVLTGPQYALLRPEFATLREYSLKRRANSQVKQLLITMGGVDLANVTGQVLEALKSCPLPADCQITVVMGVTAPWLAQVRELAELMLWPTEVLVNISDMAQRMADSDLAIGAAGSTAWERCCLGLPTLMVVLAENQVEGAKALAQHNAALSVDLAALNQQVGQHLFQIVSNKNSLSSMIFSAKEICDGNGIFSVIDSIKKI